MNVQPAKLTKEVMDKLPPATTGQCIVRDTEEPGFFVLVGARTRTFTMQVDVVTPLGKRQTKRRAVGKWPEVSVADARKAARAAKVEIAREGGGQAGGALTFGAAWVELRAAMEQDVAAGRRSAATVRGYRQQRRDTAMGASKLAWWHKKLRALPNPVRAEFHLFCLLSGSRPGALTVARWEHLDMKRRVLHIPLPKGVNCAPLTFRFHGRRLPVPPGCGGRAGWSTR